MTRGYVYQPQLASRVGGRVPAPSIGFTNPARIWPKIQEILASAEALDRDVQVYVASVPFKTAWGAWYKNWRENYSEKYANPASFNRIPVLADTDEFDRQVESQRRQLIGWYEQYAVQRQADGSQVPRRTGQPPSPAPPKPEDSSSSGSWSVPAWLWIALGAGGVALVYFAYKRARAIGAQQQYIAEEIVPKLLPAGGAQVREVARLGRDASVAGRDCGMPHGSGSRDLKLPKRPGPLEMKHYIEPNFAYDFTRDPLARK